MPLNRFITFVKPYINLAAGAIAAWLIAKANVLGIPGLGEHGNELQIGIAAALAWGVTQLATQMGDLKWLKGHHLALIREAEVEAAAVQATAALPAVGIDAEREAIMALDEELPSDDEEFAAPPPDETNVPIQPSQFDAGVVPA
jgi:hypothetical protein